jgi:lipoprotein-anchoring transpeptidase ErfK/SrfK
MRTGYRVALIILTLALLCATAFGALSQERVMTAAEIRAAADTSRELRIVVSLEARRLWVIAASGDTLRSAPVAVGSNRRISSGGRTWHFTTPRGIRRIQSAEVDPIWMRPAWAYVELARAQKVKLDSVTPRYSPRLSDGRTLSMRGPVIGTLTDAGAFVPWPVDRDILIGGVLYMPPAGSSYRGVPLVLGKFRLNLGGSIGFHGTLDKQSIGRAVTHGCMRMHDEDIEWLFRNVAVGTAVFIY